MAPSGDGHYAMGFAGDTFNTAWYASRLANKSIEISYLSAVGDDAPSLKMTEFMKNAGIVPKLAVRHGRSVGLYMISLENGERSFSYWRSTSAARTLADDLTALPDLEAGDVAFFSGITMAVLTETGRQNLLTVLAEARAKGVQVVFDPNLRPRLWPNTATMCDWIMRAAGVSEIALPSFEDEQSFFSDTNPTATADRYASAGVSTCIVKDGPGSVLIVAPDGVNTVSPEVATKVVDTTAAGDSFNAAYLVARLQGRDNSTAVQAGCKLARKVISARGALVEV